MVPLLIWRGNTTWLLSAWDIAIILLIVALAAIIWNVITSRRTA